MTLLIGIVIGAVLGVIAAGFIMFPARRNFGLTDDQSFPYGDVTREIDG